MQRNCQIPRVRLVGQVPYLEQYPNRQTLVRRLEGSTICPTLDPKLSHASAERAGVQSQRTRRPVAALNFALRLAERFDDESPLQVLETSGEAGNRITAGSLKPIRKVQAVAPCIDDRPLNNVS